MAQEDYERAARRASRPLFDSARRIGKTFIYYSMPQTDGGADFDLILIGIDGLPRCIEHGAMNKVSPTPPGLWRCLADGAGTCRAGCQEIEL